MHDPQVDASSSRALGDIQVFKRWSAATALCGTLTSYVPASAAPIYTLTQQGQIISGDFSADGIVVNSNGYDGYLTGTMSGPNAGLGKFGEGRLVVTIDWDTSAIPFGTDAEDFGSRISVVQGILAISPATVGQNNIKLLESGRVEILGGVLIGKIIGDRTDIGGVAVVDAGAIFDGNNVTIDANQGYYGPTIIRNGADVTVNGTRNLFYTERVSIDATSTLSFARQMSFVSPIAVADGATLHVDGAVVNILNPVSGGTWNKSGTGSLYLQGGSESTGVNLLGGELITDQFSLPSLVTTSAGTSIRFDDRTDGSYDGAIGGLGSVRKEGDGTLELGGINSYHGDTVIDGGRLYVTGSIANSNVIANAGATLSGTGTIGSFTVKSGADIYTGQDGIATLTVAGSGTFESGSRYSLLVGANGAADLIDVAEATEIKGGAIDVLAQHGSYAASEFTILKSAGGITGRFSTVTDDLTDLDFEAFYDDTSVRLRLAAAADGSAVSSKQVAPAAAFAHGDAAIGFVSSLGDRLGAILVSGQYSASISGGLLGYAADEPWSVKGQKAVDVPVAEFGGLAFWMGAFGEGRDIGSAGTAVGYRDRVGGFAGGADYSSAGSGQTTIGLAAGYSRSKVDVVDGGAEIASGNVGIYAGHVAGAWKLPGALAYSWGKYELARTIQFGDGDSATATAGPAGYTLAGYAEAFYDLAPQLGLDMTLGPVARLTSASTTRGGFTERGGGILNLTYDRDTISRTYAEIGILAAAHMSAGRIAFRPQVELTYQRSLTDNIDISQSSIALANATFVTPMNDGARDRLGLGLSVAIDLATSLTARASYDGTLGSGVEAHRGGLTASYKF